MSAMSWDRIDPSLSSLPIRSEVVLTNHLTDKRLSARQKDGPKMDVVVTTNTNGITLMITVSLSSRL